MKSSNDHRRHLLDELIEEEASEHGPSSDMVLRLVQREKRTRRRRLRAGQVGAVVILALLCLVIWPGDSSVDSVDVAVRSPVEPPAPGPEEPHSSGAFEVARIGDEALLEMLEDQPVALAHWPDGRRVLMVMQGAAE